MARTRRRKIGSRRWNRRKDLSDRSLNGGRAGNEKGKRNERRVLRILEFFRERLPNWFKKFRAATPEEDAEGKDVVVETDVGEISVQIKSGRMGALEWLRDERSEWIGLVVVKKKKPDGRIRNEVIEQVAQIRKAIKKSRHQRRGEAASS